jgi:transposase InsO family protein
VSRSGYYLWLKRPISQRLERRMKLIEQIKEAHHKSRCTYGSPRITIELKSIDLSVCRNTVAKYMRIAGIQSIVRKRFMPKTTDSNHPHPIAANLLDRDFAAMQPNRKWTSDITYIWTQSGWLYLAVVMDLFSRKIVGWNMSRSMKSDLVSEALKMALKTRRPNEHLLHHSDRGVQYACQHYRALLSRRKITVSMSRRGNCYDNAVAESFFGTLKSEHVHHHHYKNPEEAQASVFEWIEVFYNRQRRHSSLGYLSPEAFEAQNI